jgi:dUTP pyrophosphatase
MDIKEIFMDKIRGFEKISFKQYQKDIGGDVDLSQEYDIIKLPQRATEKSSGYDFFSVCDFQLNPGEEIKLPTGIKIYMQDDEELLIFPRSSVGFKYNVKINNTIGKIDADYYNNEDNEGHVWIKFTNTGNKIWEVKHGEAIAQGSFYKYLKADNDIPKNKERKGGLGSTN